MAQAATALYRSRRRRNTIFLTLSGVSTAIGCGFLVLILLTLMV